MTDGSGDGTGPRRSCVREVDAYTCGAGVDGNHPAASLEQMPAGELGLEELSCLLYTSDAADE